MMTTSPKAYQLFCSKLKQFHQKQFTGKLDIQIATGQTWSLYFSFGHLIWAAGSVHPTRRLRRQISKHTPKVSIKSISPRDSDNFECWDYHILTILAHRKVITTEAILAIMRGIISEVLFDLIQHIEITSVTQQLAASDHPENVNLELATTENISFKLEPKLGIRPSNSDTGILPRTWTWDVELALSTTQKIWEQWSSLGLALRSPNLALVITKPVALKSETSPSVYQNLATLINGKRSVRDLAVLLKQDLTVMTRSLVPYLRKQFISFAEIEDLPNPFLTSKPASTDPEKTRDRRRSSTPTLPSPHSNNRKLIACIDDSPQILAIAQKVIESAGYDFLGIDDAVRALPTLLQHQPHLIFLDLVMPIANGYEICSQIRRVSQFKNTPVVILTGKDGIVDRMRAKMVNATDFINKPVERQKIIEVLQKHCPLSAS